jgi:MFS family permease
MSPLSSSLSLQKSKRLMRRLAGLDYADSVTLPPEQQRCLRNMYVNGIFANFSDGAAGNYTNLFMVALRSSDAQIGLLATLVQALAALAPLPGALIAEKTHRYRATIMWPGFIARIGYVLLAVLPLMLIDQPAIALAMLIFCGRSFLTSLVGGPWTAAMGQMVPIRLRAGYFSARNFAGGLAVIAGTLIAGQVITTLGFPLGYQAVYLMSALVGFTASFFYARVPGTAYGTLETARVDPARQKAPPTRRLAWLGVLRQGPFVRFMLCSCALTFGVNIGGPFIGIYQVRVLHFNAATIGLMASAELVSNIIMQRVYGAVVIPRFGDYRVMRTLRFATALVPLAWLFVQDPLAGALVGVFVGIIWSGHDLANFNGLLEITPEEGKASAIALHTVTTSLSAAIGPVIAGSLTEVIGYHPLFIASGVLRFAAALLLVLLVRDWAVKRPVAPASPSKPAVETR